MYTFDIEFVGGARTLHRLPEDRRSGKSALREGSQDIYVDFIFAVKFRILSEFVGDLVKFSFVDFVVFVFEVGTTLKKQKESQSDPLST